MNKVAVYGTLKKNHGNHDLISDDPISSFRLKGWQMWSLGGFPGCKPVNDPEKEITVEVYEVDDETLERLDWLEGYTPGMPANFYDRVKIETPVGESFIYEYVPDVETRPLVETGDW